MERKFYTENFEKFLKGHADQFKMTPSKKVWHGIYNDLHPGKRWPSVAMSMVFIFTLVIVGHLNTNNGHIPPLSGINSLHSTNLNTPVKNSKTTKKTATKNILPRYFESENILTDNNNPLVATEEVVLSIPQPVITNLTPSENTIQAVPYNKLKPANYVVENKNEANSIEKNQIKPVQINTDVKVVEGNKVETVNEKTSVDPTKSEIAEETTSSENPAANDNKEEINTPNANSNAIKKPRRISNVTWTYYISPSLSNRYLSDELINYSVSHKNMTAFEAGTSMSFNLVKKLKFLTGFQVNYSGYKIRANNTHPIIATLILNSDIPGQYNIFTAMSHYGNSTGNEYTNLKNYSLQASLPVGLQYDFGKNENVKFGIAATIQPTFVMAGHAYMLSSDRRNYITDAELLRKWNFNTNFTTYFSFNANSLNWQLGPQIRYQLLSSYTDRYPVKESLINYGIRLGISKSK